MALIFTDYILDNIHGYIALTELESKVEKLPVFRRLRKIKQLGLSNWIFPGAEHTRYSHCLGVMHIADQMAIKLNFTDEERQFIRIAGMIHDIGHYPMSHVGERAYRKDFSEKEKNSSTEESIKLFLDSNEIEEESLITHCIMKKNTNPFHHENIGEKVIRNSNAICEILDFYGIDKELLCAVITGEIRGKESIKYLQILHSELDADRIDYLLRDTFSSGTNYGAFEINTLIKNLEMVRHKEYDIDIIGVNYKGIISTDQYLLNRYFAYSQVFFNKNVSILNHMAEQIMIYLIESENFPTRAVFLKEIEDQEKSNNFFEFTDDYFSEKIKISKFSENKTIPQNILKMILKINNYISLPILEPIEKNNIIVSGKNKREIYEELYKEAFLSFTTNKEYVFKLEKVFLTENTTLEDYKENYDKFKNNLKHSLEDCLVSRIINGISFIDGKEVKLIYDSKASLSKDLCRHRTYLLRRYSWELEEIFC